MTSNSNFYTSESARKSEIDRAEEALKRYKNVITQSDRTYEVQRSDVVFKQDPPVESSCRREYISEQRFDQPTYQTRERVSSPKELKEEKHKEKKVVLPTYPERNEYLSDRQDILPESRRSDNVTTRSVIYDRPNYLPTSEVDQWKTRSSYREEPVSQFDRTDSTQPATNKNMITGAAKEVFSTMFGDHKRRLIMTQGTTDPSLERIQSTMEPTEVVDASVKVLRKGDKAKIFRDLGFFTTLRIQRMTLHKFGLLQDQTINQFLRMGKVTLDQVIDMQTRDYIKNSMGFLSKDKIRLEIVNEPTSSFNSYNPSQNISTMKSSNYRDDNMVYSKVQERPYTSQSYTSRPVYTEEPIFDKRDSTVRTKPTIMNNKAVNEFTRPLERISGAIGYRHPHMYNKPTFSERMTEGIQGFGDVFMGPGYAETTYVDPKYNAGLGKFEQNYERAGFARHGDPMVFSETKPVKTKPSMRDKIRGYLHNSNTTEPVMTTDTMRTSQPIVTSTTTENFRTTYPSERVYSSVETTQTKPSITTRVADEITKPLERTSGAIGYRHPHSYQQPTFSERVGEGIQGTTDVFVGPGYDQPRYVGSTRLEDNYERAGFERQSDVLDKKDYGIYDEPIPNRTRTIDYTRSSHDESRKPTMKERIQEGVHELKNSIKGHKNEPVTKVESTYDRPIENDSFPQKDIYTYETKPMTKYYEQPISQRREPFVDQGIYDKGISSEKVNYHYRSQV